ncbi:MAG: SPASM domain-containing protein, partial [Bacteroidetes bacterium]|nr:SPASM domain-containing protein [Bacteroidota bacterium]
TFMEIIDNIRAFKLPFNRIPFVPRNCTNREFMFDKEILKEKLHPALRKYYHGYVSYVPFFLTREKYEQITGVKTSGDQFPVNPSVGCWCGSFYSITPEGEVAPCPLLGDNVTGGNVKETDLHDILYKSEVFTKVIQRDRFEGKCGTCEFVFACGGCRAYTYYLTGNLYGSDPTCFIDDLSEEELEVAKMEIAKNFRNYTRMAKYGGQYFKPDNM